MRKRAGSRFAIMLGALALLGVVLPLREWRQYSLDSALIRAIRTRQARRAIVLLDQGANANAVEPRNEAADVRSRMTRLLDRLRGHKPAQPGRTALFLLCAPVDDAGLNYPMGKSIDLALLKALLKHGANGNAVDAAERITPLQAQCIAGNAAAVSVLLEAGANPNIGGISLPMEIAAADDDIAGAKLLLDHGAKINASGERGFTPMDAAINFAIFHDGNEMIEFLVAHGANVNDQDARGDTPLCAATYSGPAAVRCLLKYGADPRLTNASGMTPLTIAQSSLLSLRNPTVERMLEAAERTARHKRQRTNPPFNGKRH